MSRTNPVLIHRKIFPKMKNYNRVDFLFGLEMLVDLKRGWKLSLPNKFYRFDGSVESIPVHMIKIYDEFGYNTINKEELLDEMAGESGCCMHFEIGAWNRKSRISIPFYVETYPELDEFNQAHEDMHAVQYLGLDSVYERLNKRLKINSISLDISEVNSIEMQANIAGLLQVMEKEYDPDRIRHFPEINTAYEYMMEHRT